MTGTSARETSRPAKRPRPSATDHTSNIAPPVLFRLPSISQPTHGDEHLGASAAMPPVALALHTTGSSASPLAAPAQAAAQVTTPKSMNTPSVASALASVKATGQRLFNTLVVVVLLIALAIISLLAFRGSQPAAQPELADGKTQSKDQLESLSDIRVPDIAPPQSQTASAPSASAPAAAEQETAVSQKSGTQLSLDRGKSPSGSHSAARPGLTLDASDLAKKPSGAAAQVQLGMPVPMRSTTNSALAASQESASPSTQSNLSLTTPRYETVSTPSGASSSSSNTNTGASPSLWDGAKKSAGQKSDPQSELLISESNDSEMSLIPSDYSNPSAKPTSVQPTSSKSSAAAGSSNAQTAAATASPASSSLGVTVGAGMTEPEFPQAKATATPDMDYAAISSKFLEYSRQKSIVSTSTATEIVNPYAPATPSVPATTVSTNPSTTDAYQQSPASAGVPYGTTGATLTPYVRNAPTGAVPSGLGGATYAGGMNAPASGTPMPGPSASTVYPSLAGVSAGYPQASGTSGGSGYNPVYGNPASSGSGGFAIPPRGMGSTAPTQTASAAAGGVQTGAYGSPAAQPYSYPAGAAGGVAPTGAAGYQSAPVSSSPYLGGQAPQGMIGQSGFATAPSGDVAAPIPVTGKIGYGTSPTR